MEAVNELDQRMMRVLRDVRFGRFNQNENFLATVLHADQLSHRQRWWLMSLVVRYRKQVADREAVALAEQWLMDHPEQVTEPPRPAGAVAVRPGTAAGPDVMDQPTLF